MSPTQSHLYINYIKTRQSAPIFPQTTANTWILKCKKTLCKQRGDVVRDQRPNLSAAKLATLCVLSWGLPEHVLLSVTTQRGCFQFCGRRCVAHKGFIISQWSWDSHVLKITDGCAHDVQWTVGYALQELPGEFDDLATRQDCSERLGLSQDVPTIQGCVC